MIPLILRLKRAAHRDVAKAQDLIIEALYAVFNNAVLHGGTAIWRCYHGNRFSEDIDVYLQRSMEKIEKLFVEFEARGFKVEKKKISEKSMYSALLLGRTSVRFEVLFKSVTGALKEYETAEGNFIAVYTLTAEELLKEKMGAFAGRKLIRDMYDVFFLLRHVEDIDGIKNEVSKFLGGLPKPVDEPDLKTIIIEGIVPSSEKMIEYIKAKVEYGKTDLSR